VAEPKAEIARTKKNENQKERSRKHLVLRKFPPSNGFEAKNRPNSPSFTKPLQKMAEKIILLGLNENQKNILLAARFSSTENVAALFTWRGPDEFSSGS
jgi:hypothetical protein